MDYVNNGNTNEWYTPESILSSLGLIFNLDPCASENYNNIPIKKFCRSFYTYDGLAEKWTGKVFMNPPWSGKKNAIVPWLKKFTEHKNGIAIFPARTSCDWFHQYTPKMDAILFPKGKTKFIPGPGVKESNPMAGIVIGAIGKECTEALMKSNLGLFLKINYSDQI